MFVLHETTDRCSLGLQFAQINAINPGIILWCLNLLNCAIGSSTPERKRVRLTNASVSEVWIFISDYVTQYLFSSRRQP